MTRVTNFKDFLNLTLFFFNCFLILSFDIRLLSLELSIFFPVLPLGLPDSELVKLTRVHLGYHRLNIFFMLEKKTQL